MLSLSNVMLKEQDSCKGVQLLKKSGAKVQWLLVCSPISHPTPKMWNKATMIRHLWALSAKADTLWVKWVHTFVIKNRCLLNVKLLQGSSWTVRKLFELREMAQPLISSLLAKVSSIICYENWKWPRQRNRAIMSIVAQTPPDFKPNTDTRDCVVLYHAVTSTFSVQTSGRVIRVPQPKVPWGPIIWTKGQVTRWAFILWLCFLGKLATKDRMNGWGMAVDPTC
ncbi:multidrug resistance-associated protein 3 [Actinidia rufa]|uniref:Multidrug resistance-associated protein 3 n=1 Tax=Actinidia rufa TaxID=165716 RepID=A0A7J0DKB5_9ERIC|nr:multidrug resistance-associated protein 3 [Actinidia rufa]